MISNTSYSGGDSDVKKVHLYIYMILETFLGFFIILSLALDKWFNYCYYSFGIHRIYTISSDGAMSDRFISELQDTCEDHDSYKDSTEEVCDDFCDNLDKIAYASNAIITLSTFTLILIFVNLVLYYTRLVKPDYRVRIKSGFIFGFLIHFMQFFFYLLGMILYGGIGQMHNFDDPDCDDSGNCDDFTVKGGLAIAITTCIVMLPIVLYGFIFTRKAFIE